MTNEIRTATGISTRRWLRRASSAAAIVAVVAAAIGMQVIAPELTFGSSSMVAIARADCPPDCGGGPGNGGTPSGPPGGGTEFVPPSMPAMPSYEPGRGQPPLDQNNGISIYNSAAPQPSQAAQPSQAPVQNQDGSYNRAANGEQQPVQHAPERNTEVSQSWRAMQQKLAQQQTDELDNPTQAAQDVTDDGTDHGTAQSTQDPKSPEQTQSQPSRDNTSCQPGQVYLQMTDDPIDDELGVAADMFRDYGDGVTPPPAPGRGFGGDPGGAEPSPMRLTTNGADITPGITGRDVARIPDEYGISNDNNDNRIIIRSTIPGSGDGNSGYAIGEVTTAGSGFNIAGSTVFLDDGVNRMEPIVDLPSNLTAVTAFQESPGANGLVDIVATIGNTDVEQIWQVPLSSLLNGDFTKNPSSYLPIGVTNNTLSDGWGGQKTLTRAILPDGQMAWVLYETKGANQRGPMTTRITTGPFSNLLNAPRNPISWPPGTDPMRYYGADQIPSPMPRDPSRLMIVTSRWPHEGSPDYGLSRGFGHFSCPKKVPS
ncbi:hypothetical protein [Mycobacteroides salmoniphilum]|uniref:hypothetical protein n=1 Tax=Mycobacteroides salmoniphilum TaxID=404941 RepID=UPI0010E68F51|nr:hypothetical protein [Mycobacteroides salmoniphilum]TDZ76642.1 hypothetical protein DE4586_04549 [Mycobacteroides salmoniphilum]TDZ85160.1 hypothetical protein DE4587_04087 [Mycobacteroides salmoniphilum]